MPELRDIISEIAAEVSDEDIVWTAGDFADAFIATLDAKGLAIVRADEIAELRQRMLWAGGQSPIVCGIAGSITATKEPPILASDNTPFAHHLELRPAKTKVKRGDHIKDKTL